MDAINFKAAFQAMQSDVHATARAKGWWDNSVSHGEKIALMHSELSEALEEARRGNPPDDKIGNQGFSGIEAELADEVIRIMDYAQYYGFDLAGAIVAKAEFNKSRPKMHGGKLF